MSEKTKPKKEGEDRAAQSDLEKNSCKERDADKQGNWSDDQRDKSYYYDDAYGYEVYDPNEDEND